MNYDLYFLRGAGYVLKDKGQKGLLGLRLSLAGKYLFEQGWEGGRAIMAGAVFAACLASQPIGAPGKQRRGRDPHDPGRSGCAPHVGVVQGDADRPDGIQHGSR